MLATPIHPVSFFDAMEHRGRSRSIPPTAIIRMHNHHQQQLYSPPCRSSTSLQHTRRTFYPRSRSRSLSLVRPVSVSSTSVDSLSPQSTTIDPLTPPEYALDYYDSPPTPPQSLEDQIQEAYALDNLHLAKVLFLKLKGIQVVDDADPRIDQVRDEDFPFTRLILDEEDERALTECQRREQERLLEQQRANKLAACERTWEQSVIQYREEKLKLVRQKEAATFALAEQKRLQAEAKEREALEQERSRIQYFKQGGLSPRGLLSYRSLGQARMTKPSPPPDSGFVFEYTIMQPSSSSSLTCRRMGGTAKLVRENLVQPTSSFSVPFRDVSASMHGPLFPFQPDQDTIHSDCRAGKRNTRIRHDLLDVLLEAVRWEDGERRRNKGKDREAPSTWSSSDRTLCATCSAASKSPMSSPSTLVSRSTSWLNFGGRSHKRTSLSAHPESKHPSPPRSAPTIGSSMGSPPSTLRTKKQLRHSCCGSGSIPVPFEDSPLYTKPRSISSSRPAESSPTGPPIGAGLVTRIGYSVSSLLDLASQFQAAYVRAAVFSVSTQTEAISWNNRNARGQLFRSQQKSLGGERLKPIGGRVKPSDLIIFVGTASREAEVDRSVSVIQMLSPTERRVMLTPPVTSGTPIIPSPLRPREPPPCLQYRIRPIANPVSLRLRALQNVCCVEKMEWEGRAREGALGFGKERLAGVAFEGIGRSGLAWEVAG